MCWGGSSARASPARRESSAQAVGFGGAGAELADGQLAQVHRLAKGSAAGYLAAFGEALLRALQDERGVEAQDHRVRGRRALRRGELAVAQSQDLLVEPARAADAIAGHSLVLLEVPEEGVDLKDAFGVSFAQAGGVEAEINHPVGADDAAGLDGDGDRKSEEHKSEL